MKKSRYSIKEALYGQDKPKTAEQRVEEILREVNFIYGPPEQVLNEGLLDWFGGLFKSIFSFFKNMLGFEDDASIEGLTPTQAELKNAFSKGGAYVSRAKMVTTSRNYPNDYNNLVASLAKQMNVVSATEDKKFSVKNWADSVKNSQAFTDIVNKAQSDFDTIQASAQALNNAYADALEKIGEDLGKLSDDDLVKRVLKESANDMVNILLEKEGEQKPEKSAGPSKDRVKAAKEKLAKIQAGLKKRADQVFRPTAFSEVQAGGVIYDQIENILFAALNNSIGAEGNIRIDPGVRDDLKDAVDETIKKAMASSIGKKGLNNYLGNKDFKAMAEKLNEAAASEGPVKYFAAAFAAYKVRN